MIGAGARDAITQLVVPRGNEIAVDPRSPGETRVGWGAHLAVTAAAVAGWAWLFPTLTMMSTRIAHTAAMATCWCVPPLTDDPGLYVTLAPFVAARLDPVAALRIVALGAAGLTLVAVPWRYLVPAVAALTFGLYAGDVYLVPVLAVVLAMPLLLERRSLGVAILVGLVAELYRSGAGLPVLAGTAIVLLQERPRRWLFALAAAAVGFIAVHQLGGHLLWHQIYIGLGWQPNPYGIAYLDENAMAAVARIDPTVGFMTPAYEAIIRDRVLAIASSDPGFIVRTVLEKLWALPLGLVILALFASPGRRLLLAVMFAIAMLPPVIGDTRLAYQTGLVAIVAMGLWSGDYRWVFRAPGVPRAAQRDPGPSPGDVLVVPRAG